MFALLFCDIENLIMWKSVFYDAEEEESVRTFSKLLEVAYDNEDVETTTSTEQVFISTLYIQIYLKTIHSIYFYSRRKLKWTY